jgi:putative transposase
MGRPEIYQIEQKISLDKLDWLITIKRNAKVKQKIYFIRFGYLGDSIEEATSRLGVTKRIVFYWQNRWNENSYEGLINRSGAGRLSYLN